MIKAFLFDYDGVMTMGVTDGIPAQRLAHNLNVTEELATKWVLKIWDDYSTGRISDSATWQQVEELFGGPISQLKRDIWYTWSELQPVPEMVQLVQLLKSKNYPVGVVSNVIPPTAQCIREHGGYDEFDFSTLSYEVGARKPDSRIYQAALARLSGIEAAEVVFLDDRERCVQGAIDVGMQAIHVATHSEAIQEVLRRVATEFQTSKA